MEDLSDLKNDQNTRGYRPCPRWIQVEDLSDLKNDQSIAVDPNESVGVAVDLKKPVGLKEASQKCFK